MKCWMESASSWVLISHYIFGHLHSLTSLLGWGLCSVLKAQSWGTQTLKSQNRHIILIYIFFRHLMYGCTLFPESASYSFCAFATLFLLPWMCSACNVFCLHLHLEDAYSSFEVLLTSLSLWSLLWASPGRVSLSFMMPPSPILRFSKS